jgi:DNA-binding NarL/FixJ family response regulator
MCYSTSEKLHSVQGYAYFQLGPSRTIIPLVSACTLIVDDNPNMRTALRTFVEHKTPLKVCGEAADGLEAIEKTEELKPDVILLDIAMPKLTGVEAAPILRRVAPNAHIIFVTLFADSVGARLASVMGVDRVHSKLDGMEKLADTLKSIAAASLCVQVAGEKDGTRLEQVIDELAREDLPNGNSEQPPK